MVANPARGQLNWRHEHSLSSFAPETWSRQTGSAVPSRASLLISTLRLNRMLPHGKPPAFRDGIHLHPFTSIYLYRQPTYAIVSVSSLSGHAIALRRSLPRVRRHRASIIITVLVKVVEFQQRVLPFQVSPWTNFRAPLFSHTL